jgi:hypothetical protein
MPAAFDLPACDFEQCQRDIAQGGVDDGGVKNGAVHANRSTMKGRIEAIASIDLNAAHRDYRGQCRYRAQRLVGQGVAAGSNPLGADA